MPLCVGTTGCGLLQAQPWPDSHDQAAMITYSRIGHSISRARVSCFHIGMKLLQANAIMLCNNLEVLGMLRSREADKGHLSTLLPSELHYLVPTPAGKQCFGSLGKFLADAEPLNLTTVEELQAVNIRPTTEVEGHLIVEDCDERLSNERVEQFLDVVEQTLHAAPVVEGILEADGEETAELGDGTDDMQG